MTLKQKTVAGLVWSFIDSVAGQGITFIVGIVLARLLSPREFGLIGMLTIFIAISQSLIDSGFRQALIRKQNCTQSDYSSVFYFNIAVSIFLYAIIFAGAGVIGEFYHEPVLKDLIRILALGLIFSSFSVIQSTLLTKKLDFKRQARVSIIASTLSGIVSIYMAYTGWGVWSLVALMLIKYALNSLLLWVWSEWKPILAFSVNSFRELFSFGSKLLVSGLIDTIYRNIYNLIIGKYFAVVELGYYTQADQFQALPSTNLQGIIARVSYPVLATMQDDIPRMREAYKNIVRSTMLVTFLLMLGMVAIARPMIITLIGSKWEPAIIYLQMLCFAGMFYPLHALNLNMLQVQGRSDLFLRLEIIKKALAVPFIVAGILLGIKALILGMIILSMIAFFLNSYWSGQLIGYSSFNQIKDIIPSFFIALTMCVALMLEGFLIPVSPLAMLIIQLITGTALALAICEATRFRDYLYIKEIVKGKFLTRTKHG